MQIRILNKSGTNHEVSVTLLKNTPRGTAHRKNVQSRTKIFNNVLSAVKTNSWLLSDETETRPERSTFTRSLRARACVRRRVHCWPFIISSTLFISHAFTIRYYVLYSITISKLLWYDWVEQIRCQQCCKNNTSPGNFTCIAQLITRVTLYSMMGG